MPKDFHLQSGSPVVGAGSDTQPVDDKDASARRAGSPADLGAYQLGGPAPAPPLSIGRIVVPSVRPSGVFPLRTSFTHGRARKRNVIVHQFGNRTGKVEQRFFYGPAATRYTFQRRSLSNVDRQALAAFWDSISVSAGIFSYDVPQDDQSFVTTTVCFEDQPLSLDDLTNSACSVGLTFVEIPDPSGAPSYAVSSEVTRFPSDALASALLDQAQDIIPLVRIRVTDSDVPDIFLSDRMVKIGGQLYQPRLLRIGEVGSNVLISQSIDGSSDNVQLVFGNADRTMVRLANDTDLNKARIEISLFHVGTTIKLDLWAGELVNWTSDSGPEFTVQAADIISALTLQSPIRNISRTCWRIYANSAFGCPVDKATDTRDLTHFPTSDMSFCDLGYDTDNGCLAHVVAEKSFGGCQVAPQQVKILDNSTGSVFGFGRQLITPTSEINDSIWGGTLPEIWHNDDGVPERGLPVNCRLASGRDESAFYIALGIVGRGPLGAYSTAQMVDTDSDGIKETFIGSTLDGQPHHGFKQTDTNGDFTDTSFGLRQVLGTDPAGSTDYFSLGRVGTTPTSWREVSASGSVYEQDYAAGVAFMEIRRTEPTGSPLSPVSSHVMTAMISQGLTGLAWTAPGTRTTIPGCTNPFWVAVNTFLRSLGVDSAVTAVQESYFDTNAAIAAGSTADAVVDVLVGTGTEAQFRFKGTLDTLKPLRDRLQEILNNTLGYFTWSFGKLRLGIRNSATPVTSFGSGNMLFGSLQLQPLKPSFEKLTVNFADTDYLYAANTVDYTDQDYALRNGRVQNPRDSQLGLIGASTKSQALRIAVCRTREELGGVGVVEQTNARMATWRTTILALDTEAGQVTSVIDPDIPGGIGNFRIQAWRLNRDWSIDIDAKTVTDSMYDLTSGFVPAALPDLPAPSLPPAPIGDTNVPPAPTFSARVSLDDPTSVEIYNLSTSTVDIQTILSGNFSFYYFDATASQPTISGTITSGATSVTLSSVTGVSADIFLLIGTEIVLCGVPAGSVVPITRAQFGTTAAGHTSGATATILKVKSIGASYPSGFFSSSALASWTLRAYLPAQTVAAVSGYVTNAFGNSAADVFAVNLVLGGLANTLAPAAHQFLTGYNASTGAFSQAQPADADIAFSNVTTGDVSSTEHGFAPKSPADATKFLNGATAPAYAQVKDSDLSTSNVATNDVSITKHGFAPILPNDATKFLNGVGAYAVPSGGGGSGSFPWAFVQQQPFFTGVSTSLAVTFNQTAAASGNTLYLFVSSDGSQTITNPTGWTVEINITHATYGRLTILKKTSASDTSATFTAAAGFGMCGYFFEITGAHALDQSSTAGSGNVAALTPPAITPTAGSVVFALAAAVSAGSSIGQVARLLGSQNIWIPLEMSQGGGTDRILYGWMSLVPATNVSTTPPQIVTPTINLLSGSGIAYATFSIL
jgi:hypothetical protein